MILGEEQDGGLVGSGQPPPMDLTMSDMYDPARLEGDWGEVHFMEPLPAGADDHDMKVDTSRALHQLGVANPAHQLIQCRDVEWQTWCRGIELPVEQLSPGWSHHIESRVNSAEATRTTTAGRKDVVG